jgi:hypothetical protein
MQTLDEENEREVVGPLMLAAVQLECVVTEHDPEFAKLVATAIVAVDAALAHLGIERHEDV